MKLLLLFGIFCWFNFVESQLRCSQTQPCEDGSCCSKWGYCGYGDSFCGEGCQSNCDAESRDDDESECSSERPCADGSCCSKFGYCGYGKEFCGRGCQSNCDKSKAGADYQPPASSTACSRERPCQNGACCSKWGFCGYGEEFCGKGCQSNCDAVEDANKVQGEASCSKKRPCVDESCCSKWGFCGIGEEFCGNGCQANCYQPQVDDLINQPSATVKTPVERITGKPTAVGKSIVAENLCSATKPCADGSCCSKWGFCGYGDEFCGAGCQSNCGRGHKNESLPSRHTQPESSTESTANVAKSMRFTGEGFCTSTKPCADGSCCSKWGFCGYGDEFCGRGCQSNCNARPPGGRAGKAEKAGTEGYCSAVRPCLDGSCCSQWGFCGYGDEFCGKGCQSNCGAKTECGHFAAPGRRLCALNICCSQFGYCGTTDEFCRVGCQSNCAKPAKPQCRSSEQSPIKRVVGYYAGWALDPQSRLCGSVRPEQLLADAYTHIILSFATISPEFRLVVSDSDKEISQRLRKLKQRNPKLKLMLAVGGWAFNDEPTNKIFTTMASTVENRRLFATSTIEVLESLGLDGLDIDWEYPVAEERGGEWQDKTNYVLLLKDLRRYFSGNFLLTVAAPASYWYLRNFDLAEIADTVDWINVMTYDMHGVWDLPRAPYANSHTNLTEIELSIEIYQRAGVSVEKLNLGLAFYARTFHMASKECTVPSCRFIGPAKGGRCTQNPGTLAYYEIAEMLESRPALTPQLDYESASKTVLWDDDQWMGYDDAETLRMKIDFAKELCLGGIMAWSIDQDDDKLTLQTALLKHATSAIKPPKTNVQPYTRRAKRLNSFLKF